VCHELSHEASPGHACALPGRWRPGSNCGGLGSGCAPGARQDRETSASQSRPVLFPEVPRFPGGNCSGNGSAYRDDR
jgi:hypothetical protein